MHSSPHAGTRFPCTSSATGELCLRTSCNLRELSGYDTPDGPTLAHRMLRSGSTSRLSNADLRYLVSYGVRRALDLRGPGEQQAEPDRLAEVSGIMWQAVPLYDRNLRGGLDTGVRPDDDYLVGGYLEMLSNAPAVARCIAFLSEAAPNECALFHCSMGMDRTGMLSMLVLGCVGVEPLQVVADYAYGLTDDVDEANRVVFGEDGGQSFQELLAIEPAGGIEGPIRSVAQVYQRLRERYGSIWSYLIACGATQRQLCALKRHLVG